jgi:hypothetical protein
MLREIRDLLDEHRGRIPVEFIMLTADGEVLSVNASGVRVEPSRPLIEQLGELVGDSNVALAGSVGPRGAPEPAF